MNNLDNVYSVKGDTPYIDVLQYVQQYMATAVKMNTAEMNKEDVFLYKKNIEACITANNIKCKGFKTLSELIDMLYNSMTQYDVLTPYLQQETYKRMGIEEIYGRWNCIYLLTKNGKEQLKETFPSVEIAKDIIGKIARKFNKNINEGTPTALGEFAPNIRASIVSTPVTSDILGPEFNIRIVHGSDMIRKYLLEQKTIDEYGLNLLELCVDRKINIGIFGSTGSGKTGTMYYLLSHAAKDASKRIGTIEIECREFDLINYDAQGNVTNDVFHWVTRSSSDEHYNISGNDLIEIVLRFRPDIVGIGEMRNEEAMIACEIGITGHGVITTGHANSAELGYDRIVQLCKKANNGYDDKTLYKLALQAFPILVFQMQCADGSRKVMEIVEGIDYKDDKLVVNKLFEYVVSDNNEEQGISVGSFKKMGTISDNLRHNLLRNGASKATIDLY